MTNSTKIALITGAARRIGKVIATRLHKEGFHIILHYHHSETEALNLQKKLHANRPDSVGLIRQDLLADKAAQTIIDYVVQQHGQLDVLVNNASIFYKSPLEIEKEPHANDLFICNVLAPYQLSLCARPLLRQSKGVIINITDIHGSKALKNYSLYCQSKAALIMQTKSLAKEFAPDIRVNAVAPGAIDWPEGENALSAQQKQNIVHKTPLQQHGDAEYIAQAVISLIENPFITGQNLAVDGGRSIA